MKRYQRYRSTSRASKSHNNDTGFVLFGDCLTMISGARQCNIEALAFSEATQILWPEVVKFEVSS
jgi:hypothetical protein